MVVARTYARLLLAAALAVSVLVGGRGITDEAAGSLHGDMARYLMNGAFVHDFFADGAAFSFSETLDYAYKYYARYPALSLGHHPPLLPALLAPAFAVFGPSVFAARVVIVLCFAAVVWLFFLVVKRLYDDVTAGWAALLLATAPYLAGYGQAVMSEMPTVMCGLLAVHCLLRFLETGRGVDYACFVAAAAASLMAKQLALLMIPVHVALLWSPRGLELLRRPRILAATVLIGLTVLVVVGATVALSPFNVQVVLDALGRHSASSLVEAFGAILRWQVGRPLQVAVAAGLLLGLVRRDRSALVAAVWMAAVGGGVAFLIGPIEPERYAIGGIPAYCLCAASLVYGWRSGYAKAAAALALAAVVALQGAALEAKVPKGAGGYEMAASYVLGSAPAPTVLYSGSVDTGYFVFFMRKHDTARRMVVLRADKLLTTSLMGSVSVEDRIEKAAEIYPLLRQLGTRYIVIEDRPSGSAVLDMLRTELQGERFAERLRIPIQTTDARLRGVSLVVYEYKDAAAADPNASIDIEVPLVGRHVAVRLSDLVSADSAEYSHQAHDVD